MNRLITMSLFCIITLVSSFAAAQDNVGLATFAPDDVSTVTMLLSGYHDLAPRESFDAVPNARSIVEVLAHGPHGVVTDRALAALGRYWPSADVYLLYANVVASDATADGTRYRVVLMFAEAFGDRAIPAIRPLLSSKDLQLQITAVQALGEVGTDEAVAIVNDFAKTATNPALLAQIDKSTRVLR